ncbi:hypothetical protein KIW84_045797 [Lathyrus oleraceus]|uniref:Uncharacterized protein n=1 Tax=Pisum sativum TaxID=3888 RepID=A0A9D4XP29_PEA|nr:hypothetical protein KIW84_045797 [Pisum sativum]
MDNNMVLLTLGLILVPTERDFVGYTSINLFLAVKIGDEDHTLVLLAFRPSKWSEAYEEVVGFKRQIHLLEEAYEEMRSWFIYIEVHNQEIVDALEEEEVIMVKLQEEAGYCREKYLKLVILSNDLIEEIPRSLEEAEIIAQDNSTLQPPYQTRARQKKTMEQLEQNQVALREDMDSVKGNVEGMKHKIDQLTRVITNMVAREAEADKRKVSSTSPPPHVDGNPMQGFISDIQGGKTKNSTLHLEGSIPTIV